MPTSEECQQARNANKRGMPTSEECQQARNANKRGMSTSEECQQARNANKRGMPTSEECQENENLVLRIFVNFWTLLHMSFLAISLTIQNLKKIVGLLSIFWHFYI
jgi:hypothetical protein